MCGAGVLAVLRSRDGRTEISQFRGACNGYDKATRSKTPNARAGAGGLALRVPALQPLHGETVDAGRPGAGRRCQNCPASQWLPGQDRGEGQSIRSNLVLLRPMRWYYWL